jgi:hypothetical protein
MLAVFLILALTLPTLCIAADEATTSATVQATVPSNAGPTSGDTQPPTTPILIRPHDGTYTNHSRPEFVWLSSSDPNSNYVAYHLYLNHVATFLGISGYGNSLTHNYAARLEDGSIRLLPNTSLPDGTYDWYVVAYDAAGNTSTSATWHLTIDTLPPTLTMIQLGREDNPDFIIGSDPWATITLVLVHDTLGTTFNRSASAGLSGQLTFTHELVAGDYLVYTAATDLAGNTTTLPVMTIHIGLPQTTAPTTEKSPPASFHQVFSPLSSLPATILLSATKVQSAHPIFYLIAIGTILLLIPRRKRNLILLSQSDAQPIVGAKVKEGSAHRTETNKHGECYIKHLTKRQTLTISHNSPSIIESPVTLCLLNPDLPTTTITL